MSFKFVFVQTNEDNSNNKNHQHIFDVIPLNNADNFLLQNIIFLRLESLKNGLFSMI